MPAAAGGSPQVLEESLDGWADFGVEFGALPNSAGVNEGLCTQRDQKNNWN